MIDLRNKELPHTIEHEGITYELNTDFRAWIEFDHYLRQPKPILVYDIFNKSRPPGTGWAQAAIAFLESENVTPRNVGQTNHQKIIDLVLDGDYIVASFQSAYGIDLTSVEYMHWHRFKALLDGLPDDTKLSKIMGYRSWRKDSRSTDDIMREQNQRWRLPEDGEQEALDEARSIAERLYEQEAARG